MCNAEQQQREGRAVTSADLKQLVETLTDEVAIDETGHGVPLRHALEIAQALRALALKDGPVRSAQHGGLQLRGIVAILGDEVGKAAAQGLDNRMRIARRLDEHRCRRIGDVVADALVELEPRLVAEARGQDHDIAGVVLERVSQLRPIGRRAHRQPPITGQNIHEPRAVLIRTSNDDLDGSLGLQQCLCHARLHLPPCTS